MKEHEVQALEDQLSDDERAMLDDFADGVVGRGMVAPAIFFLESMKPLGFVTSQVMYFFRPMVQVVWSDPIRYDRLAKILERRGTIELLLRRLEARA